MIVFLPPVYGFSTELFAPFSLAGPTVLYRRGQLIYLQGQTPRLLYCLQKGVVRTSILSDQGEEKLLTVYRAGSIFGEASFFDGMPRVSTATAQTDCHIVRLGHQTVDKLFPAKSNAGLHHVIAYLARTVRLLRFPCRHHELSSRQISVLQSCCFITLPLILSSI